MAGKVLTPRDIGALIHLLGDDDGWVREQARTALRAAPAAAAPLLRTASAGSREAAIRDQAELVLEDIALDDVERDWVTLQAADDGVALEGGAFLLERLIHPALAGEQGTARATLDGLTAEGRAAVPADGELGVRVAALRDFIHQACGFQGNVEDYYDPENSFLSRVLERRTGIPVTLALIYLMMGQRLGVPLVGIGLPMHFLVGYRVGPAWRYLDPFYAGREMSRGECLLVL
ncbi:MAG: transglutaminase-like domain-containing protein [Gemmatimonadota bacterium]